METQKTPISQIHLEQTKKQHLLFISVYLEFGEDAMVMDFHAEACCF
jgi:hypothetical protein